MRASSDSCNNAVFRGRPLTCPDDGQTRAVEHKMEAIVGRDQSQTAPQMLTAPGERRIVGGGKIETSISEGVFIGTGDDEVTLARALPSEYGLAGTTAFMSLSWFF